MLFMLSMSMYCRYYRFAFIIRNFSLSLIHNLTVNYSSVQYGTLTTLSLPASHVFFPRKQVLRPVSRPPRRVFLEGRHIPRFMRIRARVRRGQPRERRRSSGRRSGSGSSSCRRGSRSEKNRRWNGGRRDGSRNYREPRQTSRGR